jgi:hypothetical protein
MPSGSRRPPLIVVASANHGTADEIVSRLRSDGAVAYAAHSAHGCLRVATSVRPDIVVLDPALGPRVEKLLRAHPVSAHAQLVHLGDSGLLDIRRTTPSFAAA